jgi:histidine kinase
MDELAQLALSFNQMADRLDQTETMRRQLIGDVAHELRTPLTTIKGSMEGLMDGVLPPGEETYFRVHQEADRLERLIMDLQELSRVEANAVDLHFEQVNLERLVRATVDRLRRQFEDKNVAVEIDLPDSLPPVKADSDRIQQVLLNLVGNALQYTPEHGSVLITARLIGAEIEVTVRDTGIGISPEHLPHVFTRFYRVEKSRSRAGGGSGIGLTIAKHLVEDHGGRIWVESAGVGQGSTFHFTLK